ncbi:MAG TPA: alginate export family protein [Vicinamibacterales bacterium]|nr:alginate export family protein [Vicinamibacterales bacterium]
MGGRAFVQRLGLGLGLWLLAASGSAWAQPAAPAPIEPFLRNWTRFEAWRYFEPPPATPTFIPGDPTTAHLSNRLLAGVRMRRGLLDATVALQYVQFGWLPPDAIGPGALGTGALYFDHSGDTASNQLYLKAAHVTLRRLPGGLDLQVGRMPYTSGAERGSGVPKIEAVKRQRIDSRLVGEFEWSLYQRAYDGLRVDWASKAVQVTGTAFQPTQGGFEDAAGVSMSDIRVFSGVVTTAPGAVVPRSELQVFVHRYGDDRPVTARPDNTGRSASAVDVGVTTLGAHLVGARQAGAGELDGMIWTAGQFGSWYELDQRAFGMTAEAGYQWSKATWAPWLRGGFTWLSGDGAPADDTHGTFFPMLPTGRRYSQSTLYSLANVRDAVIQLMLRPRNDVGVRVDAHFLGLADRGDGWYAGSGATQESGRIFGYTLRQSGGETRLMEVLEGSLDWRVNPRWSVNAYLAVASRGPVVRTTFADGPAAFFYLENVVQF